MSSKTMLCALLSISAQAQWLNYRTPGTPHTADGKPNLMAPAPKALDGKPNLSGVWMHETTTPAEMKRLFGKMIDETIAVDVPGMEIGTQHKYAFDILVDHQPEESLLRPVTIEKLRQNAAAINLNGCPAAGGVLGAGAPPFPLVGLLSEPIKIVQAPHLTIVLYEAGNLHRQLHTDGRQLPKEFDLPAFNGYSAGRWEGDTLVVETAGFNDKTILDVRGHPHSEALHVTERFRRRDFGHLDYEITFDDAKMYARPFTVKIPHELLPDSEIFETYPENEKDFAHICKR
jgi:hypothetical protein